MTDPASRPQADDANGSRTHLDPAIEAARRTFARWYDVNYFESSLHRESGVTAKQLVAAAREALKPVREWFARWTPSYGHVCEYDDPRKCGWPGHRKLDPLPHEAWEELARFVFATEELEQ